MAVRIRGLAGSREEPERGTYVPYLSIGGDNRGTQQGRSFAVESAPEFVRARTTLGPRPRRPDPLVAQAFEVHPGPDDPSFAAAWQHVTIPLAVDGAPAEISALVYYPSLRGGEGAPIAQGGASPFKLVAFAHGWWPEQESYDRRAEEADSFRPPEAWPTPSDCSGNQISAQNLFTLFRGTQAVLAGWGIASIAVDLLWRWRDTEDRAARDAIRAGIDWALVEWDHSAALDPAAVGLIGHSHGTRNVNALMQLMRGERQRGEWSSSWDVTACAFLGPIPTANLGRYRSSLWIGSYPFEPRDFYLAAEPPKYLMRPDPEAHWAYLDGMCLGDESAISRSEAATQRHQVQVVLSGFLRRELQDERVADDLGLTSWRGIQAFCFDRGSGNICLRGEVEP